MFATHTSSMPKLYSIQYNYKNYYKIYNAIFGRANAPFTFRFLEVTPNNYLLVRVKDNLILCICEGELGLSASFQEHTPLIIQPIEVKEGIFVLAVQNQSSQRYICYDGYVLHQYYVGLKTVDYIEDAAIWSIQEAEKPLSQILQKNHFSVN